MLLILSFGILCFWVGYVIRIIVKREFGAVSGLPIAAVVVISFGAVFVWLGISIEKVGILCGPAVFSTYWALNLADPTVKKLRSSWAGLWLFLLFIAVEGVRTYIVMQIRK